MIDTGAIKTRINLLDLIGSDTRLRKIAGTRGGEYAGPCPFCGGEDRFRVQPEQGLWWCRSCSGSDRWHDAIAYVMQRDGTSFADAARTLGQVSTSNGRPSRPLPPAVPTSRPPPPAQWQARAEAVTRQAADDLWSDRGARARAYLHARGLMDDTLQTFVVGYIPTTRREDPEHWGLQGAVGQRVRLPRGILLPWIDRTDDEVWCLKVRRPDPLMPKYQAVQDSAPVIFGTRHLHERKTLVLVEGEFDAMLLWQAAGDLVDVATLGSASKGLDPRAALYLLAATSILVALDSDTAGQAGSMKLLASSARMRQLALPDGHDLTDYAMAGGDLRALIAEALP